ncbi:pre-peptidase C-terminal domain-containing protein [Stenotrophomonas indicatrix]|uniref:pre-peptidase C-terminal domain-containing protein n=1 Tax=Stenotrophomonas indicatrix TaxID=2045451 RepID=UPI001AA0E8FB|nr:pre-peptidase C-terminal domain-containing protein [Stenotrophomonas indicatrix]MBO1746974.1 VWA domain-containing protein [Stenotrophomonas indicatrix]
MNHYPYALLSVALMAWWSDAEAARPHSAATAITEAAQADASYAYSQKMVAERPELGVILQHFGYRSLSELDSRFVYSYNIDTGKVSVRPIPKSSAATHEASPQAFLGIANNTGGITDNGTDIVGYARTSVYCILGGAATNVGGYMANSHSRDPSNPSVLKWGAQDAGGSTTVNFAVLMAAGGAKNLSNRTVMETTHIAECGGEVQTVNKFRNWPPIRYSMVIDDTGSMEAQLAGVKGGLQSFIATHEQQGDEGRAKAYQLITFKDDFQQVLPPTSDAAQALAAVQALTPIGGGACPENSIGAVNLALDGIESDESSMRTIILATDASPHDGSDINGVIARATQNGVRVNVMLSGDCATTAGAAASSNSGAGATPSQISSRVELKRLAEETGGIYFYSPNATAQEYAEQFEKILVESENPVDELKPGEPVSGLSGDAGSKKTFRIEVPAGTPLLRVIAYGGTGNLSLYLRKGAVATESLHDAFSTRPGNSEAVQIPAPPADTYYVTVVGTGAFANATISLHLGQ